MEGNFVVLVFFIIELRLDSFVSCFFLVIYFDIYEGDLSIYYFVLFVSVSSVYFSVRDEVSVS